MYPPDKQPLVDSILGQYWNRAQALLAGLQYAQQRMSQQPKQPWGYFELADVQIDTGDYPAAVQNIQKGDAVGLPFEGHWLQLKLQQAQGNAKQ